MVANNLLTEYRKLGVTISEIMAIPPGNRTSAKSCCATERAKQCARDIIFFREDYYSLGRKWGVSDERIRNDVEMILQIIKDRRK